MHDTVMALQDLPLRPLAALLGLLLSAGLASAADPTAYVGMIDAGSSASRLYLYKFVNDKSTIEDVLEIVTPAAALSDFADDADAGDKAIGPLLAALDRALAQRGIGKPDLNIHVMATGGMRLLAPATARALEQSVRRTLVEGGYTAGRIETISGQREGLYGWLDVNLLLGRLAPGGGAPVGIVEIGGASMQIAYAGAPASDPGVLKATFGGATFSVRSVSLLGLGAEEARKTLLAGTEAASCYPVGLTGETGMTGAFDAARCIAAFAEIVAGPARALPQDEIRGLSFIGLGRPLTGVLADWRLRQDEPAALRDTASRHCTQPWATFAGAFGNTPYTPHLCANSLYLSTLLFDTAGFGLRAETVVAADRIAGRRPSWTRGAALMLRNGG
jgi:hypothetical protein